MKTLKDLKKEYPKSKYLLIKSKNVSKQFGSYCSGNYRIAEKSPIRRSGKQVVLFQRVKKCKR